MKRIAFLLVSFVCLLAISAKDDPTVMTVNGVPVSRSEFEYSYNKNNSEGVIDKKSVSEYVDLFVNYKLKVAAALDAHMDTMSSFKKEFATYRDQQIRPSFVSDEDLQREALSVYNDTKKRIGEKGLVRPAHIFIHLGQKASDAEQKSAKSKIDSLYSILKKGAVFEEVVKKYSQDNSASQGGLLPWIGPGQTLKEFEDQAYSLKKGEMSKPFLSAAGYHIILMKDKKQLEPFDSLKEIFLELLPSYNDAVFDNGKENKSFCDDALNILPHLKDIDLIYIDPPYCTSHADYQNFYHLLETYVNKWTDKTYINSIKRYEPRSYSGFDKKCDVIHSFEKLFELSKDIPHWLISYNNRSYPNIDIFKNMIDKYKDVEIKENTYTNSNGGKGSVKESKELLFVCSPKK